VSVSRPIAPQEQRRLNLAPAKSRSLPSLTITSSGAALLSHPPLHHGFQRIPQTAPVFVSHWLAISAGFQEAQLGSRLSSRTRPCHRPSSLENLLVRRAQHSDCFARRTMACFLDVWPVAKAFSPRSANESHLSSQQVLVRSSRTRLKKEHALANGSAKVLSILFLPKNDARRTSSSILRQISRQSIHTVWCISHT
jgi:hypothetical protein